MAWKVLSNRGYSVNFFNTYPRSKNDKDFYFRTLSGASVAVSMAQQETAGIAMIESVFAGCVPLVPNRVAYRELYPSLFLYDGGACGLLEKLDECLLNFERFDDASSRLRDWMLDWCGGSVQLIISELTALTI